jgi:3-dehydroquinate dehydratase/shikimate dehydrogenase
MKSVTTVVTLDRDVPGGTLEGLSGLADWLEVRGDVDLGRLRRHFGGKLLFTLDGDADARGRRARLIEAAGRYDLVTLEPRDLVPRVLEAIAPERRVISTKQLEAVERILATPAALYRVAVPARSHADALVPMRLLKSLGRTDVCAYADGIFGIWTRAVAPQLGAPAVFATLDGDTSIEKLALDYGFPEVWEAREVFAIAGDPVYSSLSPRLHNAAFRAIGRAALYIPFHVPSFRDFWVEIVESGAFDELGLPLRTICVVSPNKEIAVSAAGDKTPVVRRACSTNFFVRHNGSWTADTTDPEGVMLALRDHGVKPANQKVAVVGCGGSGRAVAAALQLAGADVTLVNRGFDRGSLAVSLLHLPFMPLAGFSARDYSIVVNATPVGRGGGEPPFSIDSLRHDAVVIELVYGDAPTQLIAKTRARGQIAIDGKEILVKQAMRQFHLMTGEEMPDQVVRDVLGMEISECGALAPL